MEKIGHRGIGGIQEWSCGPLQPWTIVIEEQGLGPKGEVIALNGITGERLPGQHYHDTASFYDASDRAESLARQRLNPLAVAA